MQEIFTQYGILIAVGLVVLYLFTKGRRHLAQVKSDAKDAALNAVMKEIGLGSLPKIEKIEKLVGIANSIKNANPKKLASSAIDVIAAEVAKIPDKDLPDLVDTEDDIEGLGAALNKAVKAEEKREKAKRGLKKVISLGVKIVKSII